MLILIRIRNILYDQCRLQLLEERFCARVCVCVCVCVRACVRVCPLYLHCRLKLAVSHKSDC